MTKKQIIDHIEMLARDIARYSLLWGRIVELNKEEALMESTLSDLRAKIESQIAKCKISISDYTKLINQN